MNNQYVVFKLSEEYYGIKIDGVENIEKSTEITRVPKTPSYVKGIINMRGEIVPIVDLRLRLNIPQKEYDSETRIIINKSDDVMIGYVVDSTYEVIDIDPSSIEFSDASENRNLETYINGIAKDNNRMIILLDLDKILNI